MAASTAASCPHRPPCGGCPLFELEASAQLRAKTHLVRSALDRFPALASLHVRDTVPAVSPFGYRARAKLAVHVGRSVAIGLFEPGTHRVVDTPECLVLHPGLRPILVALRKRLAERRGVRAGLFEQVVHVDARWSVRESAAHLTLVLRPGARNADTDVWTALAGRLMAQHRSLRGVSLRWAPGGPVVRALGGTTRLLAGTAELTEQIGDAVVRLSPGAFFQADPATAERLHAIVSGGLELERRPPAAVLDLYAGVGAFALSLAPPGATAIAVEPVPAACDDARASSQLSGRPLRVEASSAEAYVRRLSEHAADVAIDVIVVDPPRRGVGLEVLDALAGLGARRPGLRLAYVSCDPQTLARDLDALVALGARVDEVVPVDMFAQTDRVEAVAFVTWGGLGAAVEPVLTATPRLLARHGAVARRRAAGLLGGEALLISASGVACDDAEPWLLDVVALVRATPRRRVWEGIVRRHEVQGEIERAVGGHGLVALRGGRMPVIDALSALSAAGHPVIGDPHGDTATNRFFEESCALGRPFVHVRRLVVQTDHGSAEAAVPLAPDLQLVLDRLEAARQ